MALGSTVYHLEIELSDVDRGVYETLSLKAAQHPSETPGYLVARVLARPPGRAPGPHTLRPAWGWRGWPGCWVGGG